WSESTPQKRPDQAHNPGPIGRGGESQANFASLMRVIAMSTAPLIKHVRTVVCAAAVVFAVSGVAGNAWAQAAAPEEDDLDNHILNTDKRILDLIMGSIGLTSTDPTIEYRERSPLVVPQGRDLPAPSKLAKGADWPVDPEIKQRKKEASAQRMGPGLK